MKKLLTLALLLPTLAWGLTNQPVSVSTAGEPLFVVARTIEKALGKKVILQDLSGDTVVSGAFTGASGDAFMNQFASKNNFAWVEKDDKVILAPQGTNFTTLKPTDKVIAPTSFSKVLYDPKDPNKLGLMVFQIHNAWADNRALAGQQVPGVAQLFSNYVGIPVTVPRAANAAPVPEKAERVTESKSQQFQLLSILRGNAQPVAREQDERAPDLGINTRGVYADGRLNAILVRDKVSYFETYKQIVALLDKPTDMVQLDALIIDLTKDQVTDFGIDWTLGNNRLGQGGASVILGGGAAGKLLANIHASQKVNNGHTVSMPSAVTLNNVEAVFSNTRNQFIKVEGAYDATLNKVTAETALRVTPLIANESPDVPYDERRVKLLINIQDGNFDDAIDIKAPPTTSQNQLTTQAVIRSGDMLVIGGHIVKRRGEGSNGIPVLAKIPVIGGLFGRQLGIEQEFVRVYMVRARILGEDSASAKAFN